MMYEYGPVGFRFYGEAAKYYTRQGRKFLGSLKQRMEEAQMPYIKDTLRLEDGTYFIGYYVGPQPYCHIITSQNNPQSYYSCSLDHGLYKMTRSFLPDAPFVDTYEYFINDILLVDPETNEPTLPYSLCIPTNPYTQERYCSTYPVYLGKSTNEKNKEYIHHHLIHQSKEKPCNGYLILATDDKNFNGREVGRDSWVFVDEADIPWIVTIKQENEGGVKKINAYLRGIFEYYSSKPIEEQMLLQKKIGSINISNREGVEGYPRADGFYYPSKVFYPMVYCTNAEIYQDAKNKKVLCNVRVAMSDEDHLHFTTDLAEVFQGLFVGTGNTQKYKEGAQHSVVNPEFGQGLSMNFTTVATLDQIYKIKYGYGTNHNAGGWYTQCDVSFGPKYLNIDGYEYRDFTSTMTAEFNEGVDAEGERERGFEAHHFYFFRDSAITHIEWTARLVTTVEDTENKASGSSVVTGKARVDHILGEDDHGGKHACGGSSTSSGTVEITSFFIPFQGFKLTAALKVGGTTIHSRVYNSYQYGYITASYFNHPSIAGQLQLIPGSNTNVFHAEDLAVVDGIVQPEGSILNEWNLFTYNPFNNGFRFVGLPGILLLVDGTVKKNVPTSEYYHTLDIIGKRLKTHEWPLTWADRLKIQGFTHE